MYNYMGRTSRIHIVTINNDPKLRWHIKIRDNWTFQDLINELTNTINLLKELDSNLFTFQDINKINFRMKDIIFELVKPDEQIFLNTVPDVIKLINI
jgi:hypothetical protein